MSFSSTHILLVEPGDSLNIGSVARAMKNLGFRNLHLVSPPRLDLERARTTACWATDVLDSLVVHESLEVALAPMEEVVGFTARHGKNRQNHLMLFEWAEALRDSGSKNLALVFGPEDTGLRAEHVPLCRTLVRIPSADENPAYNLAQAVLLALFELRRESWQLVETDAQPDWNDFEQLDRLVTEVAEQCEFYRDGTPGPIPGVVQNLMRRTHPNKREMGVLLGLFGRINRYLRNR